MDTNVNVQAYSVEKNEKKKFTTWKLSKQQFHRRK